MGKKRFFATFDAVLSRINEGGFTHEELLDMPDFVGSEFEVMLHRHEFQFLRIQLPIRKGSDPIENAQAACSTKIADMLRDLSDPFFSRAGKLVAEPQQ
ncbi:hypothetical protein [Xanthomonas albilineans]|uniref:hypothetical protein n=1 Tax=Xanthomonas albilineans TaxID=29447 RepID=UPI0009BB7856|nr:hypothetical protein [Xanthomonas albilineans]